MAQTIKLRRSSTSGAVPTTSSLSLGEVAINTYDGKMYIKKNDGTDAIVELSGDKLPLSGGTLTGTLNFGDNVRARFGASNDLQIYHNGSDSYVRDVGAGTLYIDTNGARISLISDGSYSNGKMADFVKDGAVTLYFNNVSKFATQSYGALVSGVLLANDGSQSAPAFSFSNDSNTGMFRNSADTLGFATGGARRGYFASSGIHSDSNVYSGTGGEFRNYAGTWRASTGVTGNGFTFVNSVDGTALTLTSTGAATFAGSVTSTGLTVANTGFARITLQDSDATNQKAYIDSSGGDLNLTSQNGTSHGDIFLKRYNGTSTVLSSQFASNGDISFYNDSAAQGLFWDSSTSRLGLGTTVPSNIIHASGSGNQGIRIQSTGGGVPYFQLSTSSVGDQFIYGNVGSSQNIMFEVAGAERIRIDSSGNLRVGAGNTFEPVLQFTGSGRAQANPGFTFNNDLDTGMFNPSTQNTIAFATGGTEKMRITSAGYVGIGTTAPNAALHISGTSAEQIKLERSGHDTFRIGLQSAVGLGFHNVTDSRTDMIISGAGNVGIGTTSPAAQLHVKSAGNGEIEVERTSGALINLQAQSAAGYIGTDSNHLFGLKANGTVRLKIATGGAISFNDAFTFPITDGSAGQLLRTDGSGNMSWVTVAGVGNANIISDADGDTKIQVEESADEDKIRFDTGGIERVRVGVDSSSDSTLEIVRTGVPAARGQLTFNGSGLVTDVTSGYHSLIVKNAGSEHFRFDSSGRFLINATSTAFSDRLYMNGDAYVTGGWRTGTAATFVGELTNSSGILTLQSDASRDIQLGDTNNPDIVYVDTSTQKVGIGTNSPTRELHVNGTGNTAVAITSPNTAYVQLALGDTDDDNYAQLILDNSSNKLQIQNGGGGVVGDRGITLDSSEKVGIGTSSPSSILEVAGSAAVLTITDTRDQSFTVGDTMCSLAFDSDDTSGGSGTASHPRALISLVAETTFGSSTGLSFSTKQDTTTAPTEKMRISTAGNVGIGTNAPAQKLHVVGSAIIDGGTGVVSTGVLNVRQSGDTLNNGIALTSSHATSHRIWKDSAGKLNFGPTSLPSAFVQDLTGKVGIGTTAPGAKLHVAGAIVSEGGSFASAQEGSMTDVGLVVPKNNYIYSDDGGYLRRIIGTTTAGLIEIGQGGTSLITDIILKPGSTGNVRFFASGSEDVRINASGNVGIGNSAPTSYSGYKILHIGNATTSNTGLLKFGTGSTADGPELYAAGTSLRMNTSGSVNVLNLVGSNVGIGTTAPTQKLEVVGTVTATGLNVDVPDGGSAPATTAIIKIHGYEGRGAGIQIRDSVNSAASASNREWFVGSGYNGSHFNIGYAADGVQSSYTAQSKLIIAASTGNVGIGTSSPNRKLHISGSGATVAVKVEATDGVQSSLDLKNSEGEFRLINDGGAFSIYDQTDTAERFRIDTSGTVLVNGAHNNSGNANFAVDGGSYLTFYDNQVQIGNSSQNWNLKISHDMSSTANMQAWNSNIVIGSNGSNTGSATARDIIFSPQISGTAASTERLRIKGDGNVGIGTSSPSETLELTRLGKIGFGMNGSYGARIGYFDDGSGVHGFHVDTKHSGTTVSESRFVVRADSGNVGIGTKNPDAKLRIDQDVGTVGLKVTGGSGGTNIAEFVRDVGGNASVSINASSGDPQIQFVSAGNTFALGVNSNTFEIADNSSLGTNTRFSITNTGNVGIGIAAPTSQLHLHKDAGTAYLKQTNTANGQTLEIGNAYSLYTGASGAHSAIASDQVLAFATADAERMRIDVAGKVGIGTASPNVKLAVDGQLSTGDRRLSLGILDLNSSTTPTQFKIITNIPFAAGSADFTVNIKGFRYGTNDMVDLSIGWHYYNSTFYNSSVKSSGAWAPTVTLGVENSKVVIHLTSPGYWPKLYVESLYSSAYRDSYAAGWSWADSAISSDSGTPTVSPAYSSNFGNNFRMLDNGNVGIGTTPGAKLHVNSSGTIGWTNLANASILTGTTTSGIGIDDNEIMAKGAGHLYFGTGGSNEDVVIRAGGTSAAITIKGSNQNVGIGTTVPFTTGGNAKLTVAGILSIGISNSDMSYIRRQSSGNYAWQTYNSNNVGTIQLQPYGGSVGIGTTAPAAKLQVEELGIDTTTTSTAAVTQVAIDSMVAATFRSARYTIQVTNSTDSTYHLTEMLLIHDGTTPSINEFGTIFTGSAAEAAFTADINSGNVRILATPASTDAMAFKVVRHSITV